MVQRFFINITRHLQGGHPTRSESLPRPDGNQKENRS